VGLTRRASEVKVRPETWAIALTSWGFLLAGSPLVTIAFVGCFGAVFELASIVLIAIFVVRLLRDTQASRSRFRALGLLALILAIGAALWAAWAPVPLFGHDVKMAAERHYPLGGGQSPTGEMRLAVWRAEQSWWGLSALWIAAAILFPGSLRLLGVRAMGWLTAAFLAAGTTGPLLLGICTALVKEGWSSGN